MANLFAAGGVDTGHRRPTAGVDDVIAAFTADRHHRWPAWPAPTPPTPNRESQWSTALRAAGATRVVLAGRPKGELAELVDDHVAAGDDVVEFLRPDLRRHLTG